MASINTGIGGCLNVLPIEAQGIKFGVVTISLHVRVSEKISDNLVCMLKFDHVSTIASDINVKQQVFSLAVRPGMEGTCCPCTARGWREPAVHVRPGDGGNPLSMYGPGMEGTRCPCTARG